MSEASVAAIFQKVWGYPPPIAWKNGRALWRAKRGDRGLPMLELNRAFAAAPDEVVRALTGWIALAVSPQRGYGTGQFEEIVRPWFNAHLEAKPKRLAKAGPTHGRHHDLAALLARVVAAHGLEAVPVGWGSAAPKRVTSQRFRVTLAHYKRREKIIVVHRLLDDPRVPSYVLEDTLVHELCHHAVPPEKTRSGRFDAHGPTFQRCWNTSAERTRSAVWLRVNLPALLAGPDGKDLTVGAIGAGAETPLAID